MTGAEIFAVYGAPWILVIGGALLAWQNRIAARRAHERDNKARPETTVVAPDYSVSASKDGLRRPSKS